MFELMDVDTQDAIIKVIGVGGCGGNAIDHMISSGLTGVEFIAINTDAQALKRNQAKLQLQLGNGVTKGLGAGANPDIGREAALEDRERIAELIDGADMLFITAGMGGGTGTGAAPVVAEVAKELGILTVAVVTKPFMFEGKRVRAANTGIEALARHVDSLIIIPNEKLMQVLGEDVSMLDAFKAANEVLHGAVGGIAEVINSPGLVNVDFADVRTVMSEMGMAMMGSAQASGENRARIAAEQAVASPLLEDVNLAGARGVLVNITASSTVKMREIHEVMNTIKAFTAEEATVIVGQVLDDSMEEALRVTMVATGLGSPVARQQPKLTQIIRTGTDDAPMMTGGSEEVPNVMTSRRSRTIQAMTDSGIDTLDIPAFLRRQAD
ncbi:MAG TPA: cell division protein FtsZ [Thiobacillus sp.]|nr:cell division protein FtsZ [Thiobacillus sp.]